MATFICKMCSGPLELVDEGKFAKCTYCGTMYTLPLDDDVTAEQMIKARPIFEKAKMYFFILKILFLKKVMRQEIKTKILKM